jgi:hypothetical protein
MRWRATTWLAALLWLLLLVLIALGVVMKLIGWKGAGNTPGPVLVAQFVAFFVFSILGVLVAVRVPDNPLGWIFLACALGAATGGVTETYAYHGLANAPGSVPGAVVAAWIFSWVWYPTIVLVGVVPLLYPTGRVPGRRWRPVLWGLIGIPLVVTIGFMLAPGPLDGDPKLGDNPVGVDFLGHPRDMVEPVLTIALALLLAAVGASVVVRFRRSRGDERQQMKWMVFAVSVLALSIVVTGAGGSVVGDILFSVAIVQLPVAVGIAMLRYRLYDIDRLISRSLVYGALTVLLGGAYVGLVLGGQAVFSSFAGGSNLAIAVSTLAVAALFMPVRSRVQRFVDRRFYRRRYDAQRTLEGFGARLREQVDLQTLQAELVGVVGDTMQPTHTSLWLRTDPA